jgi:two-component system, OmpR family, response regulator
MRVLLICAREELAQPIVTRLAAQGHQVAWSGEFIAPASFVARDHDAVIAAWPPASDAGLPWLKAWRTTVKAHPLLLVTSAADATLVARELHAMDCQLIVDAESTPSSALLDRIVDELSRIPQIGEERFRCGEVEFALQDRKAWRNGREVSLTEREWSVIFALAQTPDESVAKSALATRVIGDARYPENALEVHIAALRRKLGRELIETIRGRGYRLRR